MKLLEIKIDQDILVITGELDEGKSLTVEDLDVFVNVVATKKGNFSGIKLNHPYGLLSAGIAAYFNEDTSIEFLYVSDVIKAIKKTQTHTYNVGDRKFPDYVITPSGRLHKLIAITKDSSGLGNAFYCEIHNGQLIGDSMIMTRYDGSVASDIEALVSGALIDSAINDDTFIYVDEATKTWLKEERNDEGLSPELNCENEDIGDRHNVFYKDMPDDFREAVETIMQYCQNEDCDDDCSCCPHPISEIRCGDKDENGIQTQNISQFVVATYDKNIQDLILIEEMSELTKELLKKRRGNDNREQIVEEMAHVYISLNVVRDILGISDDEINDQIRLKENKVMAS